MYSMNILMLFLLESSMLLQKNVNLNGTRAVRCSQTLPDGFFYVLIPQVEEGLKPASKSVDHNNFT